MSIISLFKSIKKIHDVYRAKDFIENGMNP